jgi:phosphoglycerate dehydrogenase-like enzyme
VEFLPLRELLHRSNVGSLHVPLTTETHHLLGQEELATMRRGPSWSTQLAPVWWINRPWSMR